LRIKELVVIVVIEIEENIMYLLLYPRNIYPKTLFQNIYPKTPMHKPCVSGHGEKTIFSRRSFHREKIIVRTIRQ
jgi:hypothetical protein